MDADTPYMTTVPVRYRDLDPMGHVNNAVYASYLEEARVSYFRDVLAVALDDIETVIASLSIDYCRPIELADAVVVEMRIEELGTTSLSAAYELRVDGEIVATATVTQVLYDRAAGEPRPIPDDWRSRIERFEGLDS